MKQKIPAWMNATKIVGGLLAVLVATAFTAGPAAADDRDHRRNEVERHGGWHGDIRRFHDHDFARWRSGRWVHGRHDGRRGWWWIAGGIWYFYPAPVYPYPDPYLPPSAVVPPTPGAQRYWYYCANPAGYYPYVPQCETAWQAVPEHAPTTYPPAEAPSAPIPPAPVSQQYWYYCSDPPGYYPTVPECRPGWQRVPATTPPDAAR